MEMVILWVKTVVVVMVLSKDWLLSHVCFWLDSVEMQSEVIAARSLPVFVRCFDNWDSTWLRHWQ